MKKLEMNKKNVIILASSIGLLFLIGYIILVNISARKLEKYTEVTFYSPTQAVVFWKTANDTLGYVKYGESILKMKQTELQTSSVEGVIHVVFLDNLPLDGVYIKKCQENGNIFVFPKIEKIKYVEPSTNE